MQLLNLPIRPLIPELHRFVAELEGLYPGRHFTPDGNIIGSIGEVLVAETYGIELFAASAPVHDGTAPDGRLVQIKATQVDFVGISARTDYLIVLKILRDGSFEEVYNGPDSSAWDAAGKAQKTSQRHVSLSKLRALDGLVAEGERIPRLSSATAHYPYAHTPPSHPSTIPSSCSLICANSPPRSSVRAPIRFPLMT